ncbi:cell wall-binding repeat-containing protein [Clostridium magnum]|uniref:cell wall-binding repeat-containing protein n=1 Tax=Clostridium magnum TaxID=33954 RepID=UPI00241FC727|nr:cell wall-binding repeat-containing protein [Clostridium magnum]
MNSSWKESKNLVLASGEDFPDALSGAAVAAKNSSFIVLTPKTPNSKTKVFLYSLTKLNSTTKNIVVLGGAGVIPDETIEKLTTREEDYLGNVINGLSVSYNNGYIL